MIDAKQVSDWDHTSALMSMICGAMGIKSTPSEINPYRDVERVEYPLEVLKALLPQ